MVRKIVVSFIFSLIVSSCSHADSGISHSFVSLKPTLVPGTGGITGYIRTKNPIDQRGLIVYLATTINYGDLIGGFLDLSNSPFDNLRDDGYFFINNVTPGDYVLVVYEVVMGGKALQSEDGGLVVFHIEKEVVLDIGVVDFDW